MVGGFILMMSGFRQLRCRSRLCFGWPVLVLLWRFSSGDRGGLTMRCSAPMRVVKRVVDVRQVFPFKQCWPRGAQRSGAESRALAVGSRSRPEPAFLPRL